MDRKQVDTGNKVAGINVRRELGLESENVPILWSRSLLKDELQRELKDARVSGDGELAEVAGAHYISGGGFAEPSPGTVKFTLLSRLITLTAGFPA